ncbi:MAG: diguanylate cyclase, partial [Paracoccaceae bacterium]
MTDTTKTLHPAATFLASEARAGKLSRREFLTRATALGITAPAAYALLGLSAPAQAQEPKMGGIL